MTTRRLWLLAILAAGLVTFAATRGRHCSLCGCCSGCIKKGKETATITEPWGAQCATTVHDNVWVTSCDVSGGGADAQVDHQILEAIPEGGDGTRPTAPSSVGR